MIAAWRRQAIEGMAATFSGKSETASATSEAEMTRLHVKIGQLVDQRRPETADGQAETSRSVHRPAMTVPRQCGSIFAYWASIKHTRTMPKRLSEFETRSALCLNHES